MSMNEYQLKVAEAKYRDVGKGIARIPKRIMKHLNLHSGDVIELEGKSSLKTSAIVWPAYSEEEPLDLILIDRITRQNAGTHLDDSIVLRKAVTRTARDTGFASPLVEKDYALQEAKLKEQDEPGGGTVGGPGGTGGWNRE